LNPFYGSVIRGISRNAWIFDGFHSDDWVNLI